MNKRKGKRKKAKKNPVSLGAVVTENLPYPVVYYPNIGGTFFAFAKDKSSKATLCLCSKPAIENLIRLKRENPDPPNFNPLRRAVLDSFFFPTIIANISTKSEYDPLQDICFEKRLCHRCNLVTPSLRYCHEMYGVEFVQHFGWYIRQAYLRFGIHPRNFAYLKDVCPPEYQNDIECLKKARAEYREEHDRLLGSRYSDILQNKIKYWPDSKMEKTEEMVNRRKIASKEARAFTTKIENIVRQEFGFRNVGEGWVSETILYQIVKRIFIKEEILRHNRPDWLEGLELDIFVPSQKLAFEYQGQQHFHSIRFWGGSEGLQDLQERDKRKAKLCASYGIDLITVDYTEPLTEDYVYAKLRDRGFFS